MTDYTTVIVLTLIAFSALALLLLAPVYYFLQREQRASEEWTDEQIARQMREHPPVTNGHPRPADEEE